MSKEVIVLIHGLWVNGMEMGWLRKTLEDEGYLTKQFSYRSIANSPFENAMDLNDFVEGLDSQTIHFVCHSLGGIVARHLFNQYPQQRPGRVVTMGAPHNSSQTAAGLSRFLPGRILLGRSVQHGLLGPVPPWTGTHELGSIAGTLRLGLGLLIPGMPQPSDGTVTVAETRLEGMTDHIEIPTTHTSMLFSKEVAKQTCQFLQSGKFIHAQ